MKIVRKWKRVSGFEDLYMISNDGKVYSLRSNRELHVKTNVVHKYCEIEFNYKGVVTYHRVHRLVAMMFIPNPLNLPFVNHIDGNKSNNIVSNLEWISGTDNNLHAINAGLAKPVRRRGRKYIVTRDGIEFTFFSQKEIMSYFGITKSQVKRIVSNINPTSLSNFNISFTYL